jgi:hypothetical protein
MATMRVRVTAGLAAWLVGAAAATGLSVFAISRLSEDAGTAQGTPLSPAEVSRALVAMAATPSGAQTDPSSPGPAASPAGTPTDSGSVGDPASVTPTSAPPSASSSSQQPQTAGSAHSSERRLSDPGGDAVAQCQGGLAYLVSWSPAQDFQVGYTQRGPSHVATVVFVGATRSWPLRVACVGGVPTRVSSDDGINDH